MTSVRGHLAASSMWAFGGFATLAVSSVVVNAVLTRAMSPPAVGVYFLAVSVVTFAATVGRAGMNQSVVRLIARAEAAHGLPAAGVAVRTVLAVAMLTAASASLVLGLFALRPLALTVFDSPRLAQLGLLLGFWCFVEALRLVASEALRGFGRIGAATVLGDAGRQVLFGAAVSVALVATGRLSVALVVACAIAAGAVVLLVALLLLRSTASHRSPETPPAALATLQLSVPMMVTALSALAVTQGDVWLAGIVLSDAHVGIYAATARLILLVVFPLHISNVVLSPVIARLHARGSLKELQHTVRMGATAAALPTLAIVSVLLLFGGPILGLVYGDAYRDGASALRILAGGQLVNALVGSCGQVLLMTGQHKVMMKVTLLAGLLFFPIGALATWRFGLVGLASASALTTAGSNVALWILVRRRLGIWTHGALRDGYRHEVASA